MNILQKVKIKRSNRRTITIQILPDASLIVKAPLFTPEFIIKKFVNNNMEWIERKLANKKMKSITKSYKSGETFLYLGKEYILEIGNYTSIALEKDRLVFPEILQFRIKKELTNWFIKQAKDVISTQLKYYASQMKAQYFDLKFSDTSSQWGRCTHDNKLQFNWRLIMAPILVVNYVVVHELAHTFEKNHSRSFWSIVRLYNPSFRQQIKWLKDHGHLLKV